MTVFLLPLRFIGWNRPARVGFYGYRFDSGSLRREFLAWYFLWVVPFGVFFQNEKVCLLC